MKNFGLAFAIKFFSISLREGQTLLGTLEVFVKILYLEFSLFVIWGNCSRTDYPTDLDDFLML